MTSGYTAGRPFRPAAPPLPKPADPTLLSRLPGAVSLLLVVALGALLAQLTWRMFPGAPAADTAELAVATATAPATAAARARQHLATPLFGDLAAAPAQAPVVETVEAPPTRLDLKLRGVAVAEITEESWAIVEGPDRKSLPYRIGDALPGEAELLRIEADRVVLRHRGAVEALYFSDEAGQPVQTSNPAATRPGDSAAIRLSPQSSTRIREYLSLLPSDPTRMTELVRALPVMENGQLRGFRLFPGQQRELFGEAGLRRGDIVTRVNGIALDDPARGMELLGQLASASQFQVEILRRGQTQMLDIQL